MKKDYYKLEIKEIVRKFNSNLDGLSESQASCNQKKYGLNEIEERKRKSRVKVFIDQFRNLLVIILILASILSFFTGGIENTIVILAVLILNALLGTIQFFKAEKSIDALKKLQKAKTIILRDKKQVVIDSNLVTCGDIVLYKRGDIISCDCRIIQSSNLEVDESILTGESITSSKENIIIKNDVSILEQKNCLFKGSKIISGNVTAICFGVGKDTQIGQIASLMQAIKKEKSPLEVDIDSFSKQLAFLIIFVCLSVFFLNIYRHITLLDSLMFAISLAVAAIPEALQTIVTIVLAISTEKMAKENAVVKDIKAIETLGCINVICTDKTGTITQNKMFLKDLFTYSNTSLFEKSLILCNEASIYNLGCESINTDEAILIHFKDKLNFNYEKLYEIPFNSTRKKLTTIYNIDNKKIMFTKGAAEVVLESCSKYLENDVVRKLDNNKRKEINEKIETFAKAGLRVVVSSYKEITNINEEVDDLIFLGIVTLYDPPKENVKEAILDCIKHHVRPVMITGDHLQTALSIAQTVGIYKEKDLYLTGEDLNNSDDKKLLEIINEVSVFARVSPQDKIKIITLLQEKGNTVAMIGDGVNDAPALKKACVGVSMGRSGTDVSKEASEVILLDDNYQTIVSAIKRGRKVYANIQNAILFLIAGNMAGIFLVLYTSILNLPTPFAPVHLLFINLINDSLPAIAIGIDERKKDYLYPRIKNNPILSKRVVRRIFIEGLLIALSCIVSYYVGLKTDAFHARSCVFITITITRLLYSFNCRGRFSVFKMKKMDYGKNNFLVLSIVFGLVLVNALLFIDILHPIFSISNLKITDILIAYFLSIIPVVIIQGLFLIREYKNKLKSA